VRKLLLLLLISACSYSFSDGITGAGKPVFDEAAVTKMVEEIKALNEQIDQLKQQYQKMDDTYKSLTSKSNTASILGDTSKEREWGNENWQDTLKNIAGGNDQRYKELYDQYVKSHKVEDLNKYKSNHTEGDSGEYTDQVQTTTAVATISQKEFERVDAEINELKKLGDQIDQTKDIKASSDLNARITQQVGYVMVEILRMQTALSNMKVLEEQDVIKGKTDTDNFFGKGN
jgi:cell division septum initiation protein DivIVA